MSPFEWLLTALCLGVASWFWAVSSFVRRSVHRVLALFLGPSHSHKTELVVALGLLGGLTAVLVALLNALIRWTDNDPLPPPIPSSRHNSGRRPAPSTSGVHRGGKPPHSTPSARRRQGWSPPTSGHIRPPKEGREEAKAMAKAWLAGRGKMPDGQCCPPHCDRALQRPPADCEV